MKIGIDCLEIKPDYAGGINTYLEGLLSGFNSVDRNQTNFIIFCSQKNKYFFEPLAKEYNFNLIKVKYYNKNIYYLFILIPIIFNSRRLLRIFTNLYCQIFKVNETFEINCNLIYVATTVLNSYNLKIPTMLSMHDIQHVHFPEFFSKLRIRVRTLRFYNSALASTRIQASSNFIKNDLLKHFIFLKSERVKVITEGVNLDEFSESKSINVKDKFSLPEKFIFYPATLWKHKNHISVLKALKIIEETKGIKIPLILTGGKNSAYNDVMSFIKENEMSYVRYLGKVSWRELISLYKNAYLLVTAVLYESSSLPILEAAASNLPIIASRTPPNVEMGKVLKLNLFDPNDTNDLVINLINCWDNLDVKAQSDFNLKKIKLYSWNNIASEFVKDFDLLLSNNKC